MHTLRTLVALCALITLALPPHIVQAGILLGKEDRERQETRAGASKETSGRWVMAYYVGYQNGYLKPRDVDYTLMTHIVVGGVGVKADGSLDEHWHLPDGDGRAMALDVGKRAKKANVRTLIWLGGPNEEDKLFAATSDAVRPTTVKNILALVDKLAYDGVDIDWEPVRKQDEPRLLALVRDLRAARPNLLITVPVNWVPSNIAATKDLSVYRDMAQYADRLFIMSYSMAGPWTGWDTWHGSALSGATSKTPSSLESSVAAYRRAGVPAAKLGIGVGTYATCWKYPVKRPATSVPANYAPAMVKSMSMRTLEDDYYAKRYEKWDATAQVPYLSFSKKRGDLACGFISYENERSIAAKTAYVTSQALGGALVWNIGTGYMPDNSRSKRHPLLGAVYKGLR